MMLYENNEIYVRPLHKTDLYKKAYEAWFYDQEVCKYNSHGVFSHGFKPHTSLSFDQEKNIIWGVFAKKFYPLGNKAGYVNNYHIGNVALQDINWINRNAEFTCIFGEKSAWGKGYCTQAMRWLFSHGFTKLNLHKIWLGTVSENHGMGKAAEKLAMQIEGSLSDHVFIDGKFKNIIRYSIRNL